MDQSLDSRYASFPLMTHIYSGNAVKGPYIFSDYNCQTFTYLMNGVNFPLSLLKIENSESNNGTATAFYSLCQALGTDVGDRQMLVSKELFDKSFFCFAIAMFTRNKCNSTQTIIGNHYCNFISSSRCLSPNRYNRSN